MSSTVKEAQEPMMRNQERKGGKYGNKIRILTAVLLCVSLCTYGLTELGVWFGIIVKNGSCCQSYTSQVALHGLSKSDPTFQGS